MNSPDIKKILCIQLKQIGDVLMTTPAVRALAKEYPDAEIHYLTEKPSNQIFEYSPYVSKIITSPKKPGFSDSLQLLKDLRKEKYSLVVDFFGQARTAVIARFTGAPVRLGFHFRGRHQFYTHSVELPPEKYSPLHKLHVLSPIGIQNRDAKLDFFISDEDKQKARSILEDLKVDPTSPLVSVSPVSRRDYKVWPAEKFAEVCDYLVETYHAQILFTWGPGEQEFIDAVREKMKQPSLPDYDIPTLRETVGLFELVDLHLGNDNGPMHFAIAARKPTIAVFGRPFADSWTPPDSDHNLAVEYDPGCKNSCTYPECGMECIKEVPAREVIAAIDSLLA